MRLLVVTDDEILPGAFRPLIQWGHRVVVCKDTETAQRVIKTDPFDLVLGAFDEATLRTLQESTGEPPPHFATLQEKNKPQTSGELTLALPVTQDALKVFIQKAIRHVESPPYDAESALRICDGDEELVADIVEVFLGDVPNQFEKIKTGFEDNDLEILRRAAHSIKGASGNIAAEPLRLAAQEMEWAAKAEKIPEIRAAFQQVQYEFHRLKTRLNAVYPAS